MFKLDISCSYAATVDQIRTFNSKWSHGFVSNLDKPKKSMTYQRPHENHHFELAILRQKKHQRFLDPYTEPAIAPGYRAPAEPCAVRAEEAPTAARPGSRSMALRWRFKCSKDKPPASFLGAQWFSGFKNGWKKRCSKAIQKLWWMILQWNVRRILKVDVYHIHPYTQLLDTPTTRFSGWRMGKNPGGNWATHPKTMQ